MIVVCSDCKNQITLDDATLPAGPFKVRCTGCGRSINVQRKEDSPKSVAPEPASPQPVINFTEKKKTTPTPPETSASTQSMESYVDGRIAAAKKEILDAMQSLFRGSSIHQDDSMLETNYSSKALICSGDPATTETLNAILTLMKYETQTSITAADAIKTVDGQFGLIVVDPSFTDDREGAKKIIGRINIKKGIERRQTFVVLLTPTQKTLDGNAAFMSGVNLIVNKADVTNLEAHIRQSQKAFQQLYSTFKSFHATQ